jgi:SulP family sulfate permease
VVFLIGLELIDIKGMRRIFVERPWEFWVALSTTAVVAFWSLEHGILLAMFLSLVAHTRHGYRPKNTVVVKTDTGRWAALPVSTPAQLMPGLLVYRFSHSMYYANTEQLSEQVLALVDQAAPPLKWFCIDCAAVDDVDFSAAATLRSLHGLLEARDVRLVLALVSEDVKAELDRSGLVERMGEDAFYASISDVIDGYASS